MNEAQSNALMEKLADLPPEYRDEDRIRLFCSIIAPGVPPDVVALVYHYAADLGLDPLRREVMPVEARSKNNGQWVSSWNIIVGIWAVTKLMSRQSDYAGMRSAVVYPGEKCIIASDGSVRHEYDINERAQLFKARPGDAVSDPRLCLPVGAWATVTRNMQGKERLFTSWMPFHQCAQTVLEDKPNGGKVKTLRSIWAQRPDWMTEKCAIMPSVRKAFAHKLGRIYAPEEFGALSTESGAIVVPEGAPVEAFAEAAPSLPEHDVLMDMHTTMPVNRVAVPVRRDDDDYVVPDFLKDAESEPMPEGAPRPAEPITRDMASERIAAAADRAEFFFKDPPRTFIKRTANGVWLIDAEALERVKSAGPLLLSAANTEKLVAVAQAIESITTDKEMSRGRA